MPALGPLPLHDATGTLLLLLLLQDVAVHELPELAAWSLQDETPTGPVLFGVQVVDVKLFPELAPEAEQV